MSISTAARLAHEAKAVFEAADGQNRPLSAEERQYVESLLERADQAKSLEARFSELSPNGFDALLNGSGGLHTAGATGSADPGARFINSEGFKAISQGNRPRSWSTGPIDVGPVGAMQFKGTLLEGAGAPGAGTGGGLVPTPQVIPGVVEKLFQPLRVEQLLSSDIATTSTFRYIIEGTATSGAAGVAEGGLKPQSTFALSTVDGHIAKIATSLKTSDEILEDVQQLQSYINGRLSLFVDTEVERQLLRGTAIPEVTGLFNAGINTYNRGTVDSYAVALFKAMNGQRGSAFMEPDWVALHPTDYQTIRLGTDNAGQFLGGGPFLGAYGNVTQVGASGQITGAIDTIWGKPAIITTAVGAGTALVGTTRAACVFNRGGLSIEATNSNETDFLYNLVSIRAERRLGLAVYRPAAFTEVLF